MCRTDLRNRVSTLRAHVALVAVATISTRSGSGDKDCAMHDNDLPGEA